MVKVGQKKRFGVIDVGGEVGEVGETGGGAGGGVGGAGSASVAAPAVSVPNEAPPEGVAEEAQVQSISKS